MVTLEALNQKMEQIKHDVDRILELLEEKDLSDGARKDLEEARAISVEKYISHDEVKKRLKANVR